MRRRKRIQMKVILTLAEDCITATSRYVSSGYFSV